MDLVFLFKQKTAYEIRISDWSTEVCSSDLVAMAEVGVDPAMTVMVGDTTYDSEMARAAGCLAIGVNWGNHEEAHLQTAGAHCVIGHFSELSQALVRLSGVSA